MRGRKQRRGVTLIELLIAITLVSLLSTGMLFAMRAGLGSMESVQRRILANRRATGAQRILAQQLGGFIPARAHCGQPGGLSPEPHAFFQGEPGLMRFVTTYSLTGASRGMPMIVELIVAPREDGDGVRLLVNEIPFHGPVGAGYFCQPPAPDPLSGRPMVRFPSPVIGPGSFVLADRLSVCRFSYEEEMPGTPPLWVPRWTRSELWPRAVRVEMAGSAADAGRVPPMPMTVLLRVTKLPREPYEP